MIEILGTVTSGLGNGQKFMSKEHYSNSFLDILGWRPFAGTLNLVLKDPIDVENIFCIENHEISGFLEKKKDGIVKERGSVKVKCVELILKQNSSHKMNGAIVLPSKTKHTNVLEVIASVELRKVWHLKDGDQIIINCQKEE